MIMMLTLLALLTIDFTGQSVIEGDCESEFLLRSWRKLDSENFKIQFLNVSYQTFRQKF